VSIASRSSSPTGRLTRSARIAALAYPFGGQLDDQCAVTPVQAGEEPACEPEAGQAHHRGPLHGRVGAQSLGQLPEQFLICRKMTRPTLAPIVASPPTALPASPVGICSVMINMANQATTAISLRSQNRSTTEAGYGESRNRSGRHVRPI
jgi:hypothetical protein